MKIINQILKFIFLLGAVSYYRINVNAATEIMVSKKELPYEVLNISMQNNSITIQGWALISYKQHYFNESDHITEIEFFSVNDTFRVRTNLTNISQTNQMQYFGSPKCGINSINQTPETCNYNYEKVGFSVSIPLHKFKINQTYQTNIINHAFRANLSYKTPVYFPIKQDINFTKDGIEYHIVSRLDDTVIKVNATTVLARKQAAKISPFWYSGSNCSSTYRNQLFFLINTNYRNVFEKVISDNTSYYRVSANLSVCDGPRRRIVEGNSLSPVWIASTYVLYSGTPLQISSNLVNQAPYFIQSEINIYQGQTLNINNNVQAFDYEEGNISHKIQIVKSNYVDSIGIYQIHLSVKDSQGLQTNTILIVNVLALPNNKPTIFAENIRLLQYTKFEPFNYVSAYDTEDGNLNSKIITLNDIRTDQLSNQEQCYYVEDSKGLNDKKCIRVEIYTNDTIYNKFRMISINNLFYREAIPSNWKSIIYILDMILK